MTSTASVVPRGDRSVNGAAGVFTSIINAAIGSAATKLERRVSAWTDKLNGVAGGDESSGLTALADEGLDQLAEAGGTGQQAGAEAVKAGLHGANPIWAAIGAAWRSGTPVVRAAIVAAVVSVVLLLLLSPVVLIVFLLSLLIIAAVQRARAARK